MAGRHGWRSRRLYIKVHARSPETTIMPKMTNFHGLTPAMAVGLHQDGSVLLPT
jgi:hypothetical protein